MFEDQEEEVRILKEKGFEIGTPCIREDGQLLMMVNNVYMFPKDVEDLVHDRATVASILTRNKGKVFPLAPE